MTNTKTKYYEKFASLMIDDVLAKLDGSHLSYERFHHPDSPSKIIIIGNLADREKDYSVEEDTTNLSTITKSSMKHNSQFIHFLVKRDVTGDVNVDLSFSVYYKVFPTFNEQKLEWETYNINAKIRDIWKRKRYENTIPLTIGRDINEPIDFTHLKKEINEDSELRKKGTLKKFYEENKEKENLEELYNSYILELKEKESENFNWSAELRIDSSRYSDTEQMITITIANTSPPLVSKNASSNSSKSSYLYDPFLFDVKLSISLNDISLTPFEFTLTDDEFNSINEVTYVKSTNCKTNYDSSTNVISTIPYGNYKQPKIVPRIEYDGLKVSFSDLQRNPVPILIEIQKKMTTLINDYKAHSREIADTKFESDTSKFVEIVARFSTGLKLLNEHENVNKAFKLMNETFTQASEHEHWRLFQIVFIVCLIPDLLNKENDLGRQLRQKADVLHVNTGGGKSETYFGIVVFLMFLNRLEGKLFGTCAITKFPLRMLSIQQLQRIAGIIIWAEKVREDHKISGDPFSIAYYVGNKRGEFPRYATDSIKQLKKEREDVRGLIIDSCPICKNIVLMKFDEDARRVFHKCSGCEREFPIFINDEEVYRNLPTLIISTVDKLSSISANRRVKNFLGGEIEYCEKHGYRPKGDKCDQERRETDLYSFKPLNCDKIKNMTIDRHLHGPELIIQDEMHLLSEAFGTIDSHFESLYDTFVQENCKWPLKYLGMTATISGVSHQIKHLYNRTASVFPSDCPYGTGHEKDLFFSKEDEIQRFIIGIRPNMRDNQYAALLTLRYVTEFIKSCEENQEEYQNILGIDNSDFRNLITYYKRYLTYHYKKSDVHSMEFFYRDVAESAITDYSIIPKRLTGDNSLNEIRETINFIDSFLKDPNDQAKTNVTFATSIVSHGVDIDTWNVMIFQGIPKKTSEYIQALSRVGRRATGVIFLWFYPNRARDLSFYHNFDEYHKLLSYKVETIPILRWSPLGLFQTFTSFFNSSILNYFSDKIKRPVYKVDDVKELFSLSDDFMTNRQKILSFIKRAYLVSSSSNDNPGIEYFDNNIPNLLEERLEHLYTYEKITNKHFFPNALADHNNKYFRTQMGMRGIEDTAVLNPSKNTRNFLDRNNLYIKSIFNPDFSSSSALFHIIPGLIISRGKYAFQSVRLEEDVSGDFNIKISNRVRLKDHVFRRVQMYYNERINYYNMTIPRLKKEMASVFSVKLIKFIKNTYDEYDEDYSGIYELNPLSFVCDNPECGNARLYYSTKQMLEDKFELKKCINCSTGVYEQIKLLFYCKDCGIVRPVFYRCKNNKNHKIRLIRPKYDSLRTWRFTCQECKDAKRDDVFSFPCRHEKLNKETYLRPDKETGEVKMGGFQPLTVIEGAIYLPLVYTTVDIPDSGDIDIDDLDFVLTGIYLHSFKSLLSRRIKEINLATVRQIIQNNKNHTAKMLYIEQKEEEYDRDIDSEEEQNKLWGDFTKYNNYESVIIQLKESYRSEDLSNFNDYLALIGHFHDDRQGYIIDYIARLNNRREMVKNIKLKAFETIKIKYGISEIKYIPQVTLISTCFGLIHGINKFWEPEFRPHFELLFNNKWEGINKGFSAYSYPYKTEGILFIVDRIKLCKWISAIKNIEININTEDEAKKYMLSMSAESERVIKILLHTISHVLINTSSIRTGIDSNSCGEIIFPRAGAIFIYSNSTINTGGFQYVFEYEIEKWLKSMEDEIEDCVFDTNCIKTSGSCFSCLYLPEFVCAYFNHDLDRATLLGKERYRRGFWQIC